MFSVLPNPDEAFIKEVNKLLMNFLWDNKPKIKTKQLLHNYNEGGIKYIDIITILNVKNSTGLKTS